MKIPDSIRIGGVEYKVIWSTCILSQNRLCYGEIDYDKSEITLLERDDVRYQHQCITLWHEILHGIREHAGLEIQDEENVVDMFAKGIYQVLQDNGGRLFDLKKQEEER